MSRKTHREKLQVGKAYTFAELYEILGASIGPERALQKYDKMAKNADVRTRLPRDSAIVSGKRAIIRGQINQMQRRKIMLRDGAHYTLQPKQSGSETGIEMRHFDAWLRESEWVTMEELIDKARKICNEEQVIAMGNRRLGSAEGLTREQQLRRGLRQHLRALASLQKRRGLLDEEEVIRFRLHKYARPKS